jgi:hypothetical protein
MISESEGLSGTTDSAGLTLDPTPQKSAQRWPIKYIVYLLSVFRGLAKLVPVKFWIFSAVGLAYLSTLAGLDFLRFPIRNDETHFWPTTLYLFQDGFPSFERLRSYNELNTPLPFLVFGLAEYYLHGGIVLGRYINFISSLTVVLLIGAAGRFSLQSALCVTGLVLCPYYLAVSTHLYTDILTVAFVAFSIYLYIKDRSGLSALSSVFAISCRQYAVVFPVGIILYDLLNKNASNKRTLIRVSLFALAAATLGVWALFFGAMAPRIALGAQRIAVGHVFPAHGIYFLSCVGLYFVILEALLFRSLRTLNISKIKLAFAVIVSCCFLLFPPVGNLDQYIQSMGYLDRVARVMMNDSVRIAFFWGLAMLTCFRFSPLSFVGIMLYLNTALMVFAHVAWDKYALPLLAVMWLLKSADRLDGPELYSSLADRESEI